MPAQSKILRNAVRCKKCLTVAESKHVHDFSTCTCGAVFTDGGNHYIHRGGDIDSMESMDVFEDENEEEEIKENVTTNDAKV